MLSSIKSLKDDSRYRYILLTIIAVTIVPVVLINGFSHFYTISKFKQSYMDARISQLKQSVTSASEMVKYIDVITNILGQDEDIIEFIFNPDESEYQKLAGIHKSLKGFLAGGQHIHSIYIYSKASGLIISSSGGIHRIRDFSDTGWIDDFDTHFLGTNNLETRRVKIDNKEFRFISFMKNLPLGTWDKVGGIIININETEFYDYAFPSDNTLSRGFVINTNGRIISHSDKNLLGQYYRNFSSSAGRQREFLGGKEKIPCYIKDDYSKWGFVLEVDVSEVTGSVRNYLVVTLFILFFIIGLIILLDLHLSREFFLPVKLLGDFQKDFEYAKPLIEGKILNNIVQNRYSSEQNIQNDLKIIDLDLSGPSNVILVIAIDKYQDLIDKEEFQSLAVLKSALRQRLFDILEDSPFSYLYSAVKRDQICLLIHFPNEALFEQQDRLAGLAETMRSQIAEEFPFTVTIGIGDVYKKMMNLHLSYQEAKNAVRHKLIHGQSRVIQYTDVKKHAEHNPGFKSPYEKQILQSVQLGLTDEISGHVKNLCSDIRKSESYDTSFVKYTFNRIVHALLENFSAEDSGVSGSVSERDFLGEFHKLETLEDIESWMIELCLILADKNRGSGNSQYNDVARKIGEYIDQNISNKNISLVEIGDALSLTPSYISRVFKEFYGYNYLEYLNKSRIEKARELLRNEDTAIADIGSRVGFSSTQSFLRVFQRYESTSPGRFRKSSRGAKRS